MTVKMSEIKSAVHTMCLAMLGVSVLFVGRSSAEMGDQRFQFAPDASQSWTHFGKSVAIYDGTAIIGATGSNDGDGAWTGAAYLFDTASGIRGRKLLANDREQNDAFGNAVAIDGATAIVGAQGDRPNRAASWYSGSAYMFDVTTGNQLAKFTADVPKRDDYFGCSVDISGGTAIVGAWGEDDVVEDSGAAYLFDVTTGAQLAKLTAPDPMRDGGFGLSVGIDGATAIVGAPWTGDHFVPGAAYLFDTVTSEYLAKLTPPAGTSGSALFGHCVAISGDTAVVGAFFDDTLESPNGGGATGAAYVFDITTGEQRAKLITKDVYLDTGGFLGASVAIHGNIAIVGAPNADSAQWYGERDCGAAYLFDVTTGEHLATLTADDFAEGDNLGNSVAIWGTTAVVGAFKDGMFVDHGSVYVYAVPEPAALFLLTIGALVVIRRRRL